MRKHTNRSRLREAELAINDVNEVNESQKSEWSNQLKALFQPMDHSQNSDTDFSKIENLMPKKRCGDCKNSKLRESARLIDRCLDSLEGGSDKEVLDAVKLLASKGLIKLDKNNRNNRNKNNRNKNNKNRNKNNKNRNTNGASNTTENAETTNVNNKSEWGSNTQVDIQPLNNSNTSGTNNSRNKPESFVGFHTNKNLGSLRDAILNINEANEIKESQKAHLDNNFDFDYAPQDYSGNDKTNFQDIESQQRKLRDAILKINEVNETNNEQEADYYSDYDANIAPQNHSGNHGSDFQNTENMQRNKKRFAKMTINKVNEVNKSQDSKWSDNKNIKFKPMTWSGNSGVDSSDVENQLRYALLKINEVNEENKKQDAKWNSNTDLKFKPQSYSNNTGSDFQDVDNISRKIRDAILKINEVNEKNNKQDADISQNKDLTYAPQSHSNNKNTDFQNVQNQQQPSYGASGYPYGQPQYRNNKQKLSIRKNNRNKINRNKNKNKLLRSMSSSTNLGGSSSSSSSSSRLPKDFDIDKLNLKNLTKQIEEIDDLMKKRNGEKKSRKNANRL